MKTPDTAFRIGDMHCRIVSDGVNLYPQEMVLGGRASDLEASMRPPLDDEGRIPVPYNCLLVRTGGATVLIDTGAGLEFAAEWGTPIGRLPDALAAADVRPEEVTHVLLTHAHADHIGGLTVPSDHGRIPVFTEARHYLSRVEHDFWLSSDHTAEYPPFPQLAPAARTHLGALIERGMLDLFDGESEPVPGIRLVPAPGHTPGHAVVVLGSGAERVTFGADILLLASQAEYPEWTLPLDVHAGATADTRRRVFDDVASDHSPLVLFHLSEVHRVETVDGAYRLVEATDLG